MSDGVRDGGCHDGRADGWVFAEEVNAAPFSIAEEETKGGATVGVAPLPPSDSLPIKTHLVAVSPP